jgi:hypothetical protein
VTPCSRISVPFVCAASDMPVLPLFLRFHFHVVLGQQLFRCDA